MAGRSLGGPRLAPVVSPSKTWSGLCGGVLGAALAGARRPLGSGRLAEGAGLGAVLAAVAQLGDLVESAFKRAAGVKDSGRLIPGHGGVLDRVDGLLLAAPVCAARSDRRPRGRAVAVAWSTEPQRSVTILGATGSVGRSTLD